MTGFVIPIAGGVASFAGEGSPYNKVAGLGFGGVPDAMAIDKVERSFAACGASVQPGSKSQQNAQRQGFDLLYTRAVLVRRP